MPLPNFLIIGAAKAGTSALYSFLGQHPQVFMSANKEPRYFSFAGATLDPAHPIHATTVTRLEDYVKLFEESGDAVAIGEASPSYLFNPAAPPRIKEMIPNVKLLAILRNPADRAFSHFMHFVKLGWETTYDFRQALNAVEGLDHNGWFPRKDYLSFGFYGEQLARYYERFDRTQIKVLIYEEFRAAPEPALKEIFGFLNVDPRHRTETSVQINLSGSPRSRTLQRWLTRPNDLRRSLGEILPATVRRRLRNTLEIANLKRSTLENDMRVTLMATYRDDIDRLEQLLERRLDCWRA